MNKDRADLFKTADLVFDRYWKIGYEKLAQPERVFVCIWGLEGEVNNGGFDQYYFNSSGEHALDAVKSLQSVGANYTAELVNTTNDLFGPGGPSPDREKRQKQLLALSESAIKKMAEADEEFIKYKDNLKELLIAFTSNNSENFQGDCLPP